MNEILIPPQVALMAPILLSEAVMTLKSARFLITVFRAFAAKHAARSGLRELKIDSSSFNLQRAYAYAETVIEVRMMEMVSLAGVIGVLWFLDVPSGRTLWLVESAYTTTGQLFAHIVISSVSLFFPDVVTKRLIECSDYPVKLVNVAIVLILIADTCAHVANAAFIATALRNKMIAGAIFIFAVMMYKLIDKGLVGLGNALRIKIQREEQSEAQAEQQQTEGEADSSAAAEISNGTGSSGRSKHRGSHSHKKKKKN